jgi:hypothetical protein
MLHSTDMLPSYLIIGGTGETSAGAVMMYVGNSFTDATGKSRRAESAIVRGFPPCFWAVLWLIAPTYSGI